MGSALRKASETFVNQILDDLESLEADKALKIPLSDLRFLGASSIPTLLQSAARKKGIALEVRQDGDSLYVWNAPPKSSPS